MKLVSYVATILLFLVTTSFAGGPITKIPPLIPTPIIQQPLPPIPIEPPPPPMRVYGDLTLYMTDYKAVLSQTGFPKFNFGESFGWSSKEVVTEAGIGVNIPKIADASFTWVLPTLRSGVGVPTVPLFLGGFVFGPRAADTINLKTKLSGERFTISTPLLLGHTEIMPTGMCEWWHLSANIQGTPSGANTSQPPINVNQDFHKVILGAGISGETMKDRLFLSYKALYAVSGHTNGWLAQADIGYKQPNMAATIGYRFNTRTLSFGTGDFEISTNGPYADLKLKF